MVPSVKPLAQMSTPVSSQQKHNTWSAQRAEGLGENVRREERLPAKNKPIPQVPAHVSAKPKTICFLMGWGLRNTMQQRLVTTFSDDDVV